jgi:hypothetical protein
MLAAVSCTGGMIARLVDPDATSRCSRCRHKSSGASDFGCAKCQSSTCSATGDCIASRSALRVSQNKAERLTVGSVYL